MVLSEKSSGSNQAAVSLSEVEFYLSSHWLSSLANFSSFIFQHMPRLNWAGFYLDDGKKLVLGPFGGKPACFDIAHGKGVCGEAFSRREALIVSDVDQFPGHIRCDVASRSELVLPFVVSGVCVGVFDLDSPELGRFTDRDREQLDGLLKRLAGKIESGDGPAFGRISRS